METSRIVVRGVVQGVGFRPFVFRKAREFGLSGSVKNTSRGVEIMVQGNAHQIAALVNQSMKLASARGHRRNQHRRI